MGACSVVIVNWNAGAALADCLAAVAGSEPAGAPVEVLLVDNASTDGSQRRAVEAHPEVTLIQNAANRGFAAAVNQGLRVARGDLALLLNPDVVLAPTAIGRLAEFMAARPEAAAAGPRLLDPDGRVQGSARRDPSLLTGLAGRTARLTRWFPTNPLSRREVPALAHAGDEPMEVDWVSGACLLARRAAYEAVGLMDERFFLFWEDADWCRRFRAAGWKVYYVPAARAVHQVGASRARRPVASTVDFHRSAYRFDRKHHPASPLHPRALLVGSGLLLRLGLQLAGTLASGAREAVRAGRSGPRGSGGPVSVLLLRTCSDAALGRVLASVRREFAGASVTLLTPASRAPAPAVVEACHVHAGGKRALLRWCRGRRWDVVAVPWTGERVLTHWKAVLPWVARARERVAVTECGDAVRLGPRPRALATGLRHLVRRARGPGARGARRRVGRACLDGVVAGLAVARGLTQAAWILGAVGLRGLAARARGRDGGRAEALAAPVATPAAADGGAPLRILVLAPHFPFPLAHGGAVRLYHYLRQLARRGAQVVLVSLIEDEGERAHQAELEPFCREVRLIRRVPARPPRAVRHFAFRKYYVEAVADAIRELDARYDFDVVQFEYTQMAVYEAVPRGRAARVLVEIDVSFVTLWRRVFAVRGWRRVVAGLRAAVTLDAELDLARRMARVVAMSEHDARVLRRFVPGLPVSVVPNGVDTGSQAYLAAWVPRARLLFVGYFLHPPNVEAVLRFARDVYPRIRAAVPDVTWLIAGAEPPPAIRALATPGSGIAVLGYVADLEAGYAASAVFVVPVSRGSGTRVKILEAMARGVPVVTTTRGVEGIAAVPERDVLIGDTPETFAAQVVRLLGDRALAERLRRQARALVEARYDYERLVTTLEDAYRAAVGAPGARPGAPGVAPDAGGGPSRHAGSGYFSP